MEVVAENETPFNVNDPALAAVEVRNAKEPVAAAEARVPAVTVARVTVLLAASDVPDLDV